jgi:hypothetical protein
MSRPSRASGRCGLVMLLIITAQTHGQESASKRPDGGSQDRIRPAVQHMKKLELRQNEREKGSIDLIETPLLTYGDSARSNENGTLWAFGKSGRPLAFVELFLGNNKGEGWVHCLTLASDNLVVMKTPVGTSWTPKSVQIKPAPIADAPAPNAKETGRLRQMKDLARRFAAHQFWDPDNSRFELRLLVQPVHRYSDAKANLHDGAVFILAHGTNPEIILLIEALGDKLETAHWHYSLARSSSAELHVELDGKEVWRQERTPGVSGKPTDPYWMFSSAVESDPGKKKE